jgi:hypothetical protein
MPLVDLKPATGVENLDADVALEDEQVLKAGSL